MSSINLAPYRREKRPRPLRCQIALRVTPEVRDRLAEAAYKQRVSVNNLLKAPIYLRHHEEIKEE